MRTLKLFYLPALLAVAAIATGFTGCATLKGDAGASIAVQYATAKIIEQGKTPEERQQKALRIKTIADEAKTWLSRDAVSIELLQQLTLARLAKLDLSPADRVLATSLVSLAAQELLAKVGQGVIPPDKLVTVNELLKWVATAADSYSS